MKVNDVLSRSTYTSGRAILALSFILIMSSVMDFKLTALPLLSETDGLCHNQLVTLSIPILGFLTIAHCLNWFSDRAESVLKHVHKDWGGDIFLEFSEWCKQLYGNALAEGRSHPPQELFNYLRDKQVSFEGVTEYTKWTTKVSLWGQHLALPVLIGLVALYLMASSPSAFAACPAQQQAAACSGFTTSAGQP